MLNKLLKFEVNATARIFLPLYAVLLIYAVIHKIISVISPSRLLLPEVISMFLYVMLLVAIFIITFVVMIQRFYKNLLSDEGYLMFTLPAKPWMLILSKLLVSMMWTLASSMAAFISIIIIAYDQIFTAKTMQGFDLFISQMYNIFGTITPLVIFEFLLAGLISLVTSILMIYASIAIGHLVNRHRVLASIGAYIGLNTISQIVSSLISIPGIWINSVNHLSNSNNIQPFVQMVVWMLIILLGLFCVGYYLITNYILSKRLNLE